MAKSTKKRKKRQSKKIKIIKIIILSIILILLIAGGIYAGPKIVTVIQLANDAKRIADESTIDTFKDGKTTIIYDTNGEQLCTMKASKDMYYIQMSDIPKTLANSFVVMEDRDFYNHSGIDIKAIIRAVIINSRNDTIVQGASTITQQLAKNVFLSQEVTWERKVKEIFLAQHLEKKYSKDQILEFYLNNIYFSNGYYGIEAEGRYSLDDPWCSENQRINIKNFCEDRKSEMEMIANYAMTQAAIKESVGEPSPYDAGKVDLEYINNVLKERKKYGVFVASISILDKDFRVVASSESYEAGHTQLCYVLRLYSLSLLYLLCRYLLQRMY